MSAASWSSVAEQKEATELHTFALAYERALTEVMMSEDVTKYPQISSDIGVIIRDNSNPLIKVDLLMKRLKGTELGKKLYVKAILSVHEIRLARELSKKEQEEQIAIERREQERQIAMERRIKVAAQVAAQEASRIGERKFNDRAHVQTAAEMAHALSNPTGTYHSFVPLVPPPPANPLKFSLFPKGKKGGKKSHRKKGGKKSHRKRSHRRRH
jgi:hypothetical protein